MVQARLGMSSDVQAATGDGGVPIAEILRVRKGIVDP